MKIHKIILIILIIITSCKESPTPPEEQQEEILPQQDIEWPSLAKTPWPMNHGNPQSTGRSPFMGPNRGELTFFIPYYFSESSISLGYNNEIFITNAYAYTKITCFDLLGNVIWEELLDARVSTTPLIADSTIYLGSKKGLSAYTYNGELKWNYSKDCWIQNIGINIGMDGTVYCVDVYNVLRAFSPEGNLLWQLHDEHFRGDAHGAPTFSSDGKTLYIQGNSVSVLAVDVETKTIKWVFGEYELFSSPVVDSYGNIYIIQGAYGVPFPNVLYALDDNGKEIWKFTFNDESIYDNTEPTIDYDGNIYFGGDTVYSVNFKGELRWKYSLDKYNIISPIVSDADCNIYIGAVNIASQYASGNRYISLNSKGELKWIIEENEERAPGASPAITNNGQLIFPTFRSKNILIIN